MHSPCAVIPVYNHETAITTVVDALIASGLPCILVDDASDQACARVLDRLARREMVNLIRLTANQGKGGAVMTGLREASRLGFSHALQVDADGQHDLQDVPLFIAQSRAHPAAVICRTPGKSGCSICTCLIISGFSPQPRGGIFGRVATGRREHAARRLNALGDCHTRSNLGLRETRTASRPRSACRVACKDMMQASSDACRDLAIAGLAA